RLTENYAGCDDGQKVKLRQGFADAATLANIASAIDTDSTAWSHYFRTGIGRDDDVINAKKIWAMVAANNDPTNPPYSLAITDAVPQDGDTLREMLVCPLFFDPNSKWTKNDLQSRKFIAPKRKANSWCAPGEKFGFFEVAGLTLLHEMTHFDVIGKAAGVAEHANGEFWFNTHGSDDVGGFGDDYPRAARALGRYWQQGLNEKDTLEPWQNAESLAAAALGKWAL
ncbi:hypothetical protein P153DRAFT_252041, partial [Dothidotthia symphoricarpi CBS 119687]